jgi:hypothetical protein
MLKAPEKGLSGQNLGMEWVSDDAGEQGGRPVAVPELAALHVQGANVKAGQ